MIYWGWFWFLRLLGGEKDLYCIPCDTKYHVWGARRGVTYFCDEEECKAPLIKIQSKFYNHLNTQ
jgi:hypothetical protein